MNNGKTNGIKNKPQGRFLRKGAHNTVTEKGDACFFIVVFAP
jgi:hypothetical protein